MVDKKNIAVYQAARPVSMPLPSAAATARLGARLARGGGPNLWLLRGPLGSGKTTLTRGALRALGVRQRVTSPTFSLVKEYYPRRGWRRVVHVDAYRLRGQAEAAALELEAAWSDPRTLVIIEWPERLRRRWPRPCRRLRLQHCRHGRVVIVDGLV